MFTSIVQEARSTLDTWLAPIRTNSESHFAPNSSSMTSDPHYNDYTNYEAAVISGAMSLGIEIPPHLRQALIHRHGEHTSWARNQHSPCSAGSKVLGLEEHFPYQSIAYFDDEREHLPGYLAGIGAQFWDAGSSPLIRFGESVEWFSYWGQHFDVGVLKGIRKWEGSLSWDERFLICNSSELRLLQAWSQLIKW